MSNIKVGGAEARATDVLGSVYEYFLEQFALAEGRKGGEFLHPAQHRAAPGRDVETLRGEGLRPMLRLIGNVRPVNGVH